MQHYLRWLQTMPSGAASSSYIVGSSSGIINMDTGNYVHYEELMNWFDSKNDDEIKKSVGDKLLLKGEELEVVCEKLFAES